MNQSGKLQHQREASARDYLESPYSTWSAPAFSTLVFPSVFGLKLRHMPHASAIECRPNPSTHSSVLAFDPTLPNRRGPYHLRQEEYGLALFRTHTKAYHPMDEAHMTFNEKDTTQLRSTLEPQPFSQWTRLTPRLTTGVRYCSVSRAKRSTLPHG